MMSKIITGVRQYRPLSIQLLGIVVAFGITACAPDKSKNNNEHDNQQISVKPDESLKQEDLQGIWLVESMEKDKKTILKFEDGKMSSTEESKAILGARVENDSKTILVIKIDSTTFQSITYSNGVTFQNQIDSYEFEKGRLLVKYTTNRNAGPRIIVPQRSGSNFDLVEKNWIVKIRRVSETELDDLLQSHRATPNSASKSAGPEVSTNSNGNGNSSKYKDSKIGRTDQKDSPIVEAANQLVHAHELLYRQPIQTEFQSRISGIQIGDIRRLKEQLERAITSSEIVYNGSSNNIGNVLFQNELQCYSGTSLFIAALLSKATIEQWQSLKVVAIHTPGHVLPGYVMEEGGRYRLIGIEMTSSDDGIIDFGLTDQIRVPIRVVEALEWAKLEVSSMTGSVDLTSPANAAIKETHLKYKIPFNPNLDTSKKYDETGKSPFSFGAPPPLKKSRRMPVSQLSSESGRASKEVVRPNTEKGSGSGRTVIDGEVFRDQCDTAFDFLIKGKWKNMEVDISEIHDIKTDAILTAADLEKRNLNTTIGFVRPQVKFSRDKEKPDILYYSYEADGRQFTRAFSRLHESDSADVFDSICRIGISGSSPQPELRDFASGDVEIVIEMSQLKNENSFPITWKNSLFKQVGRVTVY